MLKCYDITLLWRKLCFCSTCLSFCKRCKAHNRYSNYCLVVLESKRKEQSDRAAPCSPVKGASLDFLSHVKVEHPRESEESDTLPSLEAKSDTAEGITSRHSEVFIYCEIINTLRKMYFDS